MTPRPRPSPTSLACACPSVIGPPPESHRARANVVLPIARVFRPDERGMDGQSIGVRGRTTGGGHLRTRPTIRPRTRLCPVAGSTRAPGQPGSLVTSVRTGVQAWSAAVTRLACGFRYRAAGTGNSAVMGIGAGIFLLAIGAVLAFAVNWTLAGLDLHAVGWILMAAGAIGLVLFFYFWNRRRAPVPIVRQQPVLRGDPGPYRDPTAAAAPAPVVVAAPTVPPAPVVVAPAVVPPATIVASAPVPPLPPDQRAD